MSDFNAGRDIIVGRDVNVITEPSQPKSLDICTNEELFDERTRRKGLLGHERKRKFKFIGFFWVFAVVTLAAFALYFYVKGYSNLSSLILGIGGISTIFYSIQLFEQPSEFETRQLAVLKEIKLILRERGIE